MTPNDLVLCLIARQRVEKVHIQKIIDICQRYPVDWANVASLAEEQGLAPLLYWHLSHELYPHIDLPVAVHGRLKKAYMRNVLVKKRTAALLEQILARLLEFRIDALLLKGSALGALYYQHPWYTVSGDVDLVLKARREALAEDELEAIIRYIESSNQQENEFWEHIEYDFYIHHDMNVNGLLPIEGDLIWRLARPITWGKQSILVMVPEHNLIAAAVNCSRKRYFRLKSLFDLATILESVPTLNWEQLIDTARAWQCNVIVYTALIVARVLLGCSIPDEFVARLVSPMHGWVIDHLVKILWRCGSLSTLSVAAERTPAWRYPSWGLLLVYAAYQPGQFFAKMKQVGHAWLKRRSDILENKPII